MIDAVMYGMMPSAKIVKRRRLPPLNRSKMPRTEPCPCWKSDSSTLVLMPGVGMCAPMRYTASSARVNNTRFRKSGMRKRFRNASINRFIPCSASLPLRYNFERAARLRDLVLGGRAEGMRVNRQFRGQLAVAQNLDPVVAAPNESVGAQQFWRYRFSRRENVQILQVQNRIFDAERVVEAALGHPPMQRHLPAFKSAPPRIAAPRFLPFVAGAGRLAQLRSDAPAPTPLAMTRAPGWMQIRQACERERARSRFARRFAAAAGFLSRLAAFGGFFWPFLFAPLSINSARYG